MVDDIKKYLNEYEIIKITESNFEQVMEVYNTNQEFFILTEGKETTLENSINDIHAIPMDFDIENKIYVSAWKNGQIIGVLDLLMGYPEPCCVWIGLLLIHGKLHGKWHGSSIAAAVIEASKTAGYKAVQLGVIDNNEKGMKFWLNQGFKKIGESRVERGKQKALNIIVMEKQIV